MSCHVLINSPLSTQYRDWLEGQLSSALNYISIPELRRRRPLDLCRFLHSVQGERLLVPLEDGNSITILPVLELLAALTRVKRIEVILPNREIERVSRWRVLSSLTSFARASVQCINSTIRSNHELKLLERKAIVGPRTSQSDRVLYLNANLWFGLKAGGSVGHVSGVVNGMIDLGFRPHFVTAGGRLMVRADAEHVQLSPPKGYGLPYDGNYYAFQRSIFKQLGRIVEAYDFAFLYQRMSLANYMGVAISRKYRLPLVLEYNGSEVWVAKNWGRPLSYPPAAERAEEVCLKHAHAIVTISDVLRDELVARGVPREKIVSYPNCIDENIFDPQRFTPEEITHLRDRYGIARDAIVVAFLGTFGPWHGVEIMGEAIRALAMFEPDFVKQSKLHFLIVGDGVNMSKLQTILSPQQCKTLYTLAGLVEQYEAPIHLAAADIVLSPHIPNRDGTAFFGSPTKLFEYMAMGKAIIASDLDQIGQVLKKSVRATDLPAGDPSETETRLGVLCQPGNTSELVSAIKFLADNLGWRVTLGRNARREALSRYTWRHHVSAIERHLETLNLIKLRPRN